MKQKFLFGFLFAALVIFSASCKKESGKPASESYVKFKKNGTWITYTALGELGPDLVDESKTNFGISSTSDDQDEAFDISIQVDGPNFTTGVYSSDNSAYWTLVQLFNGFKTGDLKHFDITDSPTRTPSKYQVTITSITSTELEGSFTGNYLYNRMGDDTDADVVEITEGSFKVKRVR